MPAWADATKDENKLRIQVKGLEIKTLEPSTPWILESFFLLIGRLDQSKISILSAIQDINQEGFGISKDQEFTIH